jgi:hypothetical protein
MRCALAGAASLVIALAAPVAGASRDGNGDDPGGAPQIARVVEADPPVDAPRLLGPVPSGATKADLATPGATTWAPGGLLGF